MRGKGVALGVEADQVGITPAHAGKSKAYNACDGAVQDHPRTCGEKTKKIP